MGDAIMKYSKITLALAAFAATACAIEVLPETPAENQPEVQLYPMTFTAGADEGSDPETKVTLDGTSVLWAADDQIKVFDGTATPLDPFTVTSGAGTTSASFSGSVANPSANKYYALYPYQEAATFTSGNITIGKNDYTSYLTVDLPEEQQAVDGSVDPKAFLALAVSDGNGDFSFKNLNSLVKFSLSESDIANLQSISISSNSLEDIAGNMNVAFTANGDPVQTYVSGQMDSYITLKAPKEGFKANTDYFIAIRSIGFASGLTITAKYTDGTCKHATSIKAPGTQLSRNSVLSLGTLPLAAGLPNDLYIAYLHGQNIDVAGIKINRATNGEPRLISTPTKNTEISYQAGVTFLKTTDEGSFVISSTLNVLNDFYLIGVEKGKVKVSISSSINHKAGTLALKNLLLDVSKISNQVVSNWGASVDCDSFIIDGCSISNIGTALYSINANQQYSYYKYTCQKFAFVDSDFMIKVVDDTPSKINNGFINLSGTTSTNTQSLTFKNCIFYCTKNTTGKIINLPSTLSAYSETISFNNNTIFNIHAGGNAGLLHVIKGSSLEMNNNIFSFYGINNTNNEYIIYNTEEFTISQLNNKFHKRNAIDKNTMYLYKNNTVLFEQNDICAKSYPYASTITGIGATRTGAQSLSARQTWSGVSEWN